MAGLSAVTSDVIGKKVRFTSKSLNDEVKWQGTVEAVGGYKFARAIDNPIPYNAAVRKADPAVGEVTELSYFLITLDNNSDEVQTRLFANEWILSNSLEVIDELAQVKITVFDLPTNNHQAILATLRAAGYSAVIDSVV